MEFRLLISYIVRMRNGLTLITKTFVVFALMVIMLDFAEANVSGVLSVNKTGAALQGDLVSDCLASLRENVGTSTCRAGEVPTSAAMWLFFVVLLAFVGLLNKNKL